MIFYSESHVEHTFSEKRAVNQKNFTFHETRFFFKCWNLHISKINPFLDFKQNKIIKRKLRTT